MKAPKNWFLYNCLLSLLFVSSGVQVGCTRASKEEAKMSISLQNKLMRPNKVGSLGSAILTHATINITGEGISQPIYLSWDLCQECGANATAPASFELTVPRGNNRLIQLLAVYTDSTGSEIMYGDVSKSLMSNQEEVSVELSSLAHGVGLITGRISGRYLTTNDHGPTGQILIKYLPANKPAMIIDRAPIVSGWFNVFGLKDINFNYELLDGTVIFSNVNLTTIPGENLVTVETPSHYQNEGSSYRWIEEHYNVYGFWGNAAATSSKKACYSTGSLLKSYTSSDTVVYTPLTTSFGTKDSSKMSFMGTSCSGLAGSYYVDFLSISPSPLESGEDRSAGFMVPFKLKSSSSGDLQVVVIEKMETSANLTFDLLPNVDSTDIEKFVFFKRVGVSQEFHDHSSGAPCLSIASGEIAGFSPIAEKPLLAGISSYNQSINMQSTDWDNTQMAICAVVKGQFSNIGVFLDKFNFSKEISAGPPTQLSLQKVKQPFGGASSYSCEEISVGLMDSKQMRTTTHTDITVNLEGTDGVNNASFYSSSSDCMSQVNSKTFIVIPSMQTQSNAYVKTPTNSGVTLSLTASSTGSPSLAIASLNLSIKSYPAKTLMLDMPQSLLIGQCYMGKVKYIDYSGYSFPVTVETVVHLASSGSLQYFSDSTCSTPASSVTLQSSSSEAPVWVKLPSYSSNNLATLTVDSGDSAEATSIPFYTGGGGTTLSQIQIIGPSSLSRDTCSNTPFYLKMMNDQMMPLPLSMAATLTATISGSNAPMFMDSGCATPLSSNISPGVYEFPIYLKPIEAGSANLSANVGGVSASLIVSVQGLYNLSLSTSESVPVNHGTCVQVQLQPLNFDTSPGFFYSSTEITLGSGFYQSRQGTSCVNPITSLTLPAYDNTPRTLYVLVTNNSIVPGSFSASASASNVQSANLLISTNAAPILAILGNTLDITAEYSLDLSKNIIEFTGVSPFTFTQNSGSGSLSVSTYTPSGVNSNVASFSINDTNSSSFSFSTTEHTQSSTLDFTSNLNAGSLTRASTGYYFDAAGVLTSAPLNAPRFDHNPDSTSSFDNLGLLLEGASTNLITQSENLSSLGSGTGYWNTNSLVPTPTAATSIVSPRGITSDGVYLLDDTNLNGYNVERIANQFSNDMSNDVDYVASMFIKSNTSRFAGLMLNENGVNSTGVVIDLNSGQIWQMEGPYTPQVKQGIGVQKLNNGWYRVWVRYHTSATCTNTGSGPCQGWIAIFPAHSSAGNLSGEISASGSVYIFGVQVEQNSGMSSYIKTTGTVGTREADVFSLPTSDVTGFQSNGAGAFKLVSVLPDGSTRGAGTLMQICGSICSSQSLNINKGAGEQIQFDSIAAGASNPTLSSQRGPMVGAPNAIGFSWSSGSSQALNMGIGGEAFTSGGVNVNLPTISSGTIYFGNNSSGNSSTNMYLKKLEYWPSKLSAPAMASW